MFALARTRIQPNWLKWNSHSQLSIMGYHEEMGTHEVRAWQTDQVLDASLENDSVIGLFW